MKKQVFAPLAAILISTTMLLIMFCVSAMDGFGFAGPALADPMQVSPTVEQVNPASAPNDLDTAVVITGTGFTAGLSGTLVITQPIAYLGDTALPNVTWVSSATLHAVVPWGMDPGVYTLTVVNPDGEASSLTDAFTVTQGIDAWRTGGPYGGWIESLVLGDDVGEIVYAIAMNVGAFRSQDGGANWELIFIETGHENRLEVDPTNPDRLYISKIGPEKEGLYRSEDGGDIWEIMPQPGMNVANFRAFVNPHNGILYGALFSDLSGVLLGLFRFDETDQTWIRLEESGLLDETTAVTAVGFDPVDPQTMYAGLLNGMVIRSTDGGETWASSGQTPLDYIKELVVNPVGGEPWVCGPGGALPGGLYRYDGNEWVSVYTSPHLFTAVRNIVFDPGAADVQTQHIWIAAVHDEVLKSEDGGQSWVSISSGQAEAIALNPLHPLTIYSGRPEGVFKTSDGGTSWQPVNEGLAGIVPSYLGVNPINPAIVYGAFVGLYGSSDGGETWQQLPAACSGLIAVDPNNPQHVVVGCQGSRLNVADDGWTFNREITIPLPPEMDESFYAAHVTSIEVRRGMWLLGVGYMDFGLPYFNWDGGGGIYLSEDGEDWTLASPLQTCPPTSFGFDPVDPHIFYAATSGFRGGVDCEGTFLKSTDNGQTWQESVAGLTPDAAGGGLIAIEPTPPYRIIFGGFVSSDQGVTWSEVANPSESHLNQMLFLRGSPSILYVATGAGLYRSVDGAQTWQRAAGALGQLEIWSLAGTTIGDRQILYAASVGGAVDSSAMQTGSQVQSNETLINAGVYRYTTGYTRHQVYLPLVVRAYGL